MERRVVSITGIVQGIGFRPFVFRLATRFGLAGFVRNESDLVRIEIEGDPASLDQFLDSLCREAPRASQIDELRCQSMAPVGESGFQVIDSILSTARPVFLSPDLATCDECLAELFDPADRRFRYPFLNCSHCGPRLTVVCGAPYDRERTTMAAFAMCAACRAEYDDPTDRRFHAQPIACPACGPRLTLLDGTGRRSDTPDPLAAFVAALRDGQIGALRGLGGFHLACDAANERTVNRLRQRKQRDEKPLAIMVRDAAAARELCHLSDAEQRLLASPQRPIVLLRRRADAAVAPSVAPGNPFLGVMLPYTPLHHLLAADMPGRPLVMTSGNIADEPIACDNDEAVARMKEIADLFLVHDRPIHVRCDDSVTRCVDGVELPMRRSRGYAPRPLRLPIPCAEPLLAVGGQLKGVFALGLERQAILSHHLGDLDHVAAYEAFERDVLLYQQLFHATPRWIVHDLHPDYASTRYARLRAEREGLAAMAVQHHHAHLASCMAEHGLNEPVIGLTWDGTGYGIDEADGRASIWGGEFLVGTYRMCRRAAHLRQVALPGGERAIREPWRAALAHVTDAGEVLLPWRARLAPTALRSVAALLERGVNSPLTSSMGRLFDAVASLVGIRDVVNHEGQAAMELEWMALETAADGAYPVALDTADQPDLPAVVDTRPIIRGIVDDVRRGVERCRIARRFHATLAEVAVTVCRRIRAREGLEVVVLSGGVFLNVLLTREVTGRLTQDGFRVFRHERVPPNDAGLSLGQLAVAAARVTP